MNRLKGFTLLEILIALAVFAILATITGSALLHAFNTRERLNQQASRLESLQLAISLLERDSTQITARHITGNDLSLVPALVGQADYLEFTRGGINNPQHLEQRSAMKRIAYLCKNNQLIRRTWPTLDDPHRDIFYDKILLQDVNHCQFDYLNETLNVLSEWRAANLPQANGPAPLPKAIRLSLALPGWGEASLLFIVPGSAYESH